MRRFGGYYTAARVSLIRSNVERFDWARDRRREAIERAKLFLEPSLTELWHWTPGQNLPRCIDVTGTRTSTGFERHGCLACGDAIYSQTVERPQSGFFSSCTNYPYYGDWLQRPWKIECPNCHTRFPANDFGKFYRSAIDDRGMFDPERGDRSLLFNASHPDPADPFHHWAVDDGSGYTDPETGIIYRWIAYHSWAVLWPAIYEALASLSEAFLLTGQHSYAARAAILLARIADVYPSMDWAPYAQRGWYHSDGGSGRGKIEGRIWETGVLTRFAEAYERILSGLEGSNDLYFALRKLGRTYKLPAPVGNASELIEHIDSGLLRTGARAVQTGQIHGNEGMRQHAIARCAVALDINPESGEWLDWIFDPAGGDVTSVLKSAMDRDGAGAEGGPGYALVWRDNFAALGELLTDYAGYDRHDLFRDFPSFRQSFLAGYRMAVLDWTTPSIGDSGTTGKIGIIDPAPELLARAYRRLKDPAIAAAAWHLSQGSEASLSRDLDDPDSEALGREIAALGRDSSGQGSRNMAGYGLVSLEHGSGPAGTAVWMYYGRNGVSHAHRDQLNIGVYAHGFDLAPDFGYPEYANAGWPKRTEWNNQTLSHNLVLVDESAQQSNWVGVPRFFKTCPRFHAVEVSAQRAYPQTQEYARTLALIPVDDVRAYIVDLFRVHGGNDHLFLFHGPGALCETTGLELFSREDGSYDGPDVAPGPSPRTGREDMRRIGYSWLYNVAKTLAPVENWQVEWRVPGGYHGATDETSVHLRLHHLSAADDVATADGSPPAHHPGNPERVRFVLAHRHGSDLSSDLLSVLEPYDSSPFIASVERLHTDGTSFALRVQLVNGCEDLILYHSDGGFIEIPEGARFQGVIGFIRRRGGVTQRAAMIDGTLLEWGQFRLLGSPSVQGHIAAYDRERYVYTAAPLPADIDVSGQEIIIAGDRARNGCFTIHGVEQCTEGTRLDLGDVSFERGTDHPLPPNPHNPGAAFRIPSWDFYELPSGEELG